MVFLFSSVSDQSACGELHPSDLADGAFLHLHEDRPGSRAIGPVASSLARRDDDEEDLDEDEDWDEDEDDYDDEDDEDEDWDDEDDEDDEDEEDYEDEDEDE